MKYTKNIFTSQIAPLSVIKLVVLLLKQKPQPANEILNYWIPRSDYSSRQSSETLQLLVTTGLVDIDSKDMVSLNNKLIESIDEKSLDTVLKKLIIESMDLNLYKALVNAGISDMSGSIIWDEKDISPILYGLRDMLLDFSMITRRNNLLFAEDSFVKFLYSKNIYYNNLSRNKRLVSPNELIDILANLKHIGDIAEQFVLEVETNRLSNRGLMPVHEAIVNTASGYDIKSYSENSYSFDKFIEVKAITDSRAFYISENELLVASELKDRYYLCLVEIQAGEPTGLTSTIRDPYKSIFNNSNSPWERSVDSYRFSNIDNIFE